MISIYGYPIRAGVKPAPTRSSGGVYPRPQGLEGRWNRTINFNPANKKSNLQYFTVFTSKQNISSLTVGSFTNPNCFTAFYTTLQYFTSKQILSD
jgi:hypothetical protein